MTINDEWEGPRTTSGSTSNNFGCVTPLTQGYYGPHSLSGYQYFEVRVDKTEKALKILKVLIAAKKIKVETVEEFIDVLDELIKIL